MPQLKQDEDQKNILEAKTPADDISMFNAPYHLSYEQRDFYRKNGFIKLEKVLYGDALKYTKEIIEAAVKVRKENDKRILAEKSQYEQSFMQCGFLCWDYDSIYNFVTGKRFAGIASQLMSVSGVKLWHDQALFKEPGGRKTNIHQDSSYWPVKQPEYTITMWLALNSVPKEKGCLYFYPGTHRNGLREYVDIFKNPHEPEGLDEREKVFVPLEPGDATFHSGLIFHGAGENKTEEMREGMTVIYMTDKMRYDNSDPRNATHKSASGTKENEIINTKYTPRLYP